LNAVPIFDQPHYDSLNQARGDVVRTVLASVASRRPMRTAIDVGCGFGYFSGMLSSLGFAVTAVDGREENVREARRRFPVISAHVLNAEDPALRSLGQFDLVFCFGLLYHLENPFSAIRHLRAISSDFLLVESVIYQGPETIMGLVDEGYYDDQGLNHVAFYPTENCLIKMFYKSGFPFVYRVAAKPRHPEYSASRDARKIRTVLAASLTQLNSNALELAQEPRTVAQPWDPRDEVAKTGAVATLRRFAKKPLLDKVQSVRRLLSGQLRTKLL
jgi:SAM-dependent methyltransferase